MPKVILHDTFNDNLNAFSYVLIATDMVYSEKKNEFQVKTASLSLKNSLKTFILRGIMLLITHFLGEFFKPEHLRLF